jgi:hypothetical protein
LVLTPIAMAIVWSIPFYDHSALKQWILINTLNAYGTFLFMAAISHLILRVLHLKAAWQYCLVMFCVALPIHIGSAIYNLQDYNSLYYSQTQVVEHGKITASGYMLQVTNSLKGAAFLTVAFLLFWFIAVRKPRDKRNA